MGSRAGRAGRTRRPAPGYTRFCHPFRLLRRAPPLRRRADRSPHATAAHRGWADRTAGVWPDRYRAAGPAGASIQIDALMLQLQRPRRRAMPSPAVGGDRTALASSPGTATRPTQKRRWVCVNGGFPERARKHGRLVRQRHDRFAADGHKQCSVWLRSQWPHLMAGLTHVSRLLSLKPQASSTSKAGAYWGW